MRLSPRGYSRRRLPVLCAATALMLGGGAGLLTAALTGASAGADSTLGGFTVTALAEGATVQYEQPNLPLPSDPSVELDEGYAATSDNFGPTGNAVASTFYPGQVIANAGPELALLVPGAPLPPAPVWPLEATSDYPQVPNTASLDEPGVNMDVTSTANSNTATATLGDDAPASGSTGSQSAGSSSGTGNLLGASSSILGLGIISGTSTSSTTDTAATASASATVSGISLLAGFITIGAVTSTATATSDGSTGKVTGSTVLSGMTIAGQSVTVTANGIQAVGASSILALPISALNTLLNELGITLTVSNATDSIQGAGATRTLDGLKLTINLNTLDDAANKFASLLPESLTSQLPIPIPNQQLITVDLGTVTVASSASQAFDDSATPGTASGDDSSSGGFSSPSTGTDTFGGSGDLGSTGGFTTPPSGTGTSTTPGSTTPLGSGTGEPTSAVTPVFKGIGTGLVLLGLAAAAALAYAYKRVDDV
ncbi:MAG TPA: choice-of-anchor P family protein, partial [Acidimicrobiales bacterium]